MRIEESISGKSSGIRKKTDVGTLLFFLGFIPVLAAAVIRSTMLPYAQSDAFWVFQYVLTILVCVAMAAKALFLDEYPNRTVRYVILLLLVLTFCQSAFLVLSWELSTVFALCVGSYGVDIKKIFKVYLLESLSITVVALILSLFGVIPNLPFEKFGRIRYGLGTIYCTDFAARIFFLTMVVLILYCSKIRIPHLVVLGGIAIAVFIPTFGKLDFACSILALLIFGIHKYVTGHENGTFAKRWSAAWKKISLFSMPVAAVVMFLLSYFYSPDNPLTRLADEVTTGRLILGKNGFSAFGVTIFGQSVIYGGAYTIESYNFVDCSYLNMLFKEGVIAVLAVIALFVLIAWKHREHLPVLYTVFLLALNCMLAHHLIEIAYHPFLLFLLADCRSLFEEETSPEHKTSSQEHS